LRGVEGQVRIIKQQENQKISSCDDIVKREERGCTGEGG